MKWLKVVILFLLCLGACYFLGISLQKINQAFVLILSPDTRLLDTFIYFLIAFCAVVLAVGLVIILIQPFILTVLSLFLGGIALLLGWRQFSWGSVILSLIFFLFGVCFTIIVQQSIARRIKFTIQPFSEKRGILLFSLILLACGSLYMGGKVYIAANGFSIPNEYFELFMAPMKEQALSQVPEKERELKEAEIDAEFETLFQNFQETKLKPFESFIPLVIAVILFFPLFTIMNVAAIIPILLLGLLIKLLIVLKFARIVIEDEPVEHLLLED